MTPFLKVFSTPSGAEDTPGIIPFVCKILPFVCHSKAVNYPFISKNIPYVENIKIQAGFSLFELFIVVTIAGVITAFGLPNFTRFVEINRLAATTNDLIADMGLSRTEALKRQEGFVAVCISTTGTGCTAGGWKDGWMVYWDRDSSGAYNTLPAPADEILRVHSSLPSSLTLSTSPAGLTQLSYNRLGAAQTGAAALTITNSKISESRLLCISTTGRATLASGGAC